MAYSGERSPSPVLLAPPYTATGDLMEQQIMHANVLQRLRYLEGQGKWPKRPAELFFAWALLNGVDLSESSDFQLIVAANDWRKSKASMARQIADSSYAGFYDHR